MNFMAFIASALASVLAFSAHADEPSRAMPTPVHRSLEAVVSITVATQRELLMPSVGSGMVIRSDGLILTSASLFEGQGNITVETADRSSYVGEMVGKDKISGLALLRIAAKDLRTVTLGDDEPTKPGRKVWALGRTSAAAGGKPLLAAGAVSASLPIAKVPLFVESTVQLVAGMGGGPLLDEESGRVIGVNGLLWAPPKGQAIALSVPVAAFKRIEAQLLSVGRVRYGSIGVTSTTLTAQQAAGAGLPRGGALVRTVRKTAGEPPPLLEVGDLVLMFDGKPVDDMMDLASAVRSAEPGTTKAISVLRRGTVHHLDVPVVEMPARD
ncbi:S1C family serine protease [Roseateles sp. P5_D6]